MRLRSIAFFVATSSLAMPVLAQTYREQTTTTTTRTVTTDRPMNPAVTKEELKDKYDRVADQRESRATKLSAEDYRELARQRTELHRLMRRIDAGETISASDVDQALGNDRTDLRPGYYQHHNGY
jgi:ribosome assembly protein YihI (activator of Der GTPase)